MQLSHSAHASAPAGRPSSRPAAAATQGLSPMERLMDLLHEVRQFSRQLQRSAREAAAHADQRSYAEALRALLDSRMQGADARMRIVCYASAAELGLSLELEAEHCRQAMSGGLGFPLRVLFWAAHRRMRAARRRPGAWLQPQR
ncbi:conserved exported hypothetical protein [Cupriavidus taiwanensis]|uniref:Uncharacterized protein n=1 Tax=Cupriavidus taiwanensis TaxID=164546 RepID=A0A976B0I8_9BURK|nr:hypothetical protein [Cupriavidus taiwanensis]SOZ64504.1 conserved exported hypothetical protein [Cupriavidus taiwanensis]SOZ65229.1 conserved exported hypothetical protein [Cupriavidus taiwanensis]SOZ68852.1 conserved exported hypothetical protein [Cupriavidus taiwanensis]SPA08290.1 conserved exported hypothetical protein [Cupriavidus taiwanensis]